MTPADIDVIVLAGGLGTRLRSALPEDCPKFLAPFGDKPFANRFFMELETAGFRKFILALGHNAEQVFGWFADYLANPHNLSLFQYTVEAEPSGIDNAIKFAGAKTTTDPVAVCNGDTLWDTDFGALIRQHESNSQPAALIRGEVLAGFWLLPRSCLLQPNPLSFAFGVNCRQFYDIGTPEGLERAKRARDDKP